MAPGVDFVFRALRAQELALFARRAQRQLGRGFVLVLGDESPPVYINCMMGAPVPLQQAVAQYDPEHEALIVCQDEDDLDTMIVSRVKIEMRH